MRQAAQLCLPLALMVAVAGCTSTEATLQQPNGAQASRAAAETQQPPLQTSAAEPVSPAALSNVRLQFAPVVGATVEAATPLSRRLASRASERGIAMARAGESAPTHIMKGYFSADVEAGSVNVFYVWDVLDGDGNRLHRIFGQERVQGAGAEPWSQVPAATMESIAASSIDQFTTWVGRQSN